MLIVLFSLIPSPILSQISDKLFKSDYHIESENVKSLFLEIDNLNFFKDNEYAGLFQKGYTLPGFWATAKVVYYPLSNIKLEGGVYGIRYWGANRYPNMAYQDIAKWKGDQYMKGFHLLPWLRAQIDLSDKVSFVFGDIYGASNHDLILPLYDPELNFTADPEMGLQFLFDNTHAKVDVWVNWESFIYRGDTHQEAFTIGASSKIKWNSPDSRVHVYSPVQILAQHRGGEIDTIYSNSVQTLMNGAVGVGATWNIGYKAIKRLNVELDATGYYQQAGSIWPFNKGAGVYASTSLDISDFKLLGGYWWCQDFISMFGSPFFGAVSTSNPGMYFGTPSLFFVGGEYSRVFAKHYSFGAAVNVYHQFSSYYHTPEIGDIKYGSKTSFSGSIFFRVNPSFLLKKFNRN